MATSSNVPADAERPTGIRWGVFGLAFSTSGLLYLHRYSLAFIKPHLAEEWGLSKTELGLLDSTFFTSYTVPQLPIAVAADALGVRLVLTLLMLVWMLGLALLAWSPTVNLLRVALALLGLGQSAVYACLSRAARIWFPPAIRTTLQGAVGVFAGRLGGWAAGLVFSTLLMGTLLLKWREATWVLVGLGGLQTIAFCLFYRNTPRVHPLVNAAEADLIEGRDPTLPTVDGDAAVSPVVPRMTVMAMLRGTSPRSLTNLMAFSAQCTLSTFADVIYSSWIPMFLWEVHHLKLQEMGIYSGLPLLGGAVAGVLGGLLNDFCLARTGNRRWARSSVGFVGKGMAAVLLFSALLYYDNPYAFCGMLFFVKLFGDWSLASTWGVVSDIGGRATASVYAFSNTVAGVASISAPAIYGYLAQHKGWPYVFQTAALVYVLCAVSWLFIDCTIPVVREVQPDDANSVAV